MMLASIKTNEIAVLLSDWLLKRIAPESFAWLNNKRTEIRQTAAERTLFIAFSSISRHIEKRDLELSAQELQAASQLVIDWNPALWTLDQVSRTILILSFPQDDADRYVSTLNKIFAAADMQEAIALYQSLPLLPYPERFKLRAAEGVRTNMTAVFNAIAINNPYPAQYLDDLAWNQMILKALFVGTPLHPIYGLKSRNNPQLAQMLVDYARERLAAQRTVSPELWDLVAPFDQQAIADLQPKFSLL